MSQLYAPLCKIRYDCGHHRLEISCDAQSAPLKTCDDCEEVQFREELTSQLERFWVRLGLAYKAAGVRFFRSLDAVPGFGYCNQPVQVILREAFLDPGSRSTFGEAAFAIKKDLLQIRQLFTCQAEVGVPLSRSVLAQIDGSHGQIADSIRRCQRLLIRMQKSTNIARQVDRSANTIQEHFDPSNSWSRAKMWSAYYISIFETELHLDGLTSEQLACKVFDQPEQTLRPSGSNVGLDDLDFGILSLDEGHVPAEPFGGNDDDLGIL